MRNEFKGKEINDRGMRKWRPFASIPEQYIGLKKVFDELNKVEKPLLSEEQQEEVNEALGEALHSRRTIRLTHYKNGHCDTEPGEIVAVDVNSKTFMFIDLFGFKNKMELENIVAITFE
ncbi:YolD-like family protein [Bacillus megaterium]|nr:YolD-like family protein [Priestia megaterium]